MRTTVISICRATVILAIAYWAFHPQAGAMFQGPIMAAGLLLVGVGLMLEARRKIAREAEAEAAQPVPQVAPQPVRSGRSGR
ncbi:MAG: hypothetical protein NTW19_07075 [Planctomycetota bacterium]|nr:hypothetical protein [Planctomycetota bacterium]